MKKLLFVFSTVVALASCADNKEAETAEVFCDTTCSQDTFKFNGNHKQKPFVSISVQNCTGDTLTWSHSGLPTSRQMHMGTLLDNLVRLNESAISVHFNEANYAWLAFNDCVTGRGYLMKLPFDKTESINKMSSALNSFDKKFVLADDLRAYADYSTIYVVDVNSGKTEQMTFKEEYKINWNKIHEAIDSINVTHNRIFVQLIKDGQKVPLEKEISL